MEPGIPATPPPAPHHTPGHSGACEMCSAARPACCVASLAKDRLGCDTCIRSHCPPPAPPPKKDLFVLGILAAVVVSAAVITVLWCTARHYRKRQKEREDEKQENLLL